MGSTVAAGDGDGRRLYLERPDFRQPLQSRLRHHWHQVERSALLRFRAQPRLRGTEFLDDNASRSDVRPEQFERRARLIGAIARGRRWLDDVVSGRVTTVAELCTRGNCSVRQVNMAISLAFLAPNLVKAAVEGRLPRGIGIGRLRDPPTEWSRQFEALG